MYTKIDLRRAYRRIRSAAGDEWKTALRTRYVLLKWLVMPLKLFNTPALSSSIRRTLLSSPLLQRRVRAHQLGLASPTAASRESPLREPLNM